MMGFGIVNWIFLGATVLAVIFGLAKVFPMMIGLFKSVGAGHAMLTCPHCGQQTSHAGGQCDACGREL